VVVVSFNTNTIYLVPVQLHMRYFFLNSANMYFAFVRTY
jgi:hypothetical protein